MRFDNTTRALFGALALGLSAFPAFAQNVQAVPVASLTRPVFLTTAPGEPGVLYVVQAPGQIVRLSASGDVLGTFLDISDRVAGGSGGETGLLGLAFSPDYETSGRFFVNYTSTVNSRLTTVIEEFRRAQTGVAETEPAQRLFAVAQPFANHNGGWLAFGPDGYLYIALGDGGSGNDPGNNASNLNTLFGKLLRVDTADDSVPYTIPPTNPFGAPLAARDEIWAYGLRNPWRNSFDRETGDLWIADVGQDAREEINFQPASSVGGEHYGWRCREGNIATPGVTGCPETHPAWVDPIRVYSQGQSGRCSITGGYVYRGCAMGTQVYGKYFYGDFCTGEIWTHDPATGARNLQSSVPSLSSFGEDENGELYALSLAGIVFRLEPIVPGPDADNDGTPDRCDCPAEFNGDGILDHGDIGAFVDAFVSVDAAADLNRDGVIDNDDISVFIQAFIETCR